MTELQAKLASLSIFKELDAAELALLAERVQWLSIIGGSILFFEGDQADNMFVVLSGRVGAFKRNAKGDLELLAHTESGETVGEMALLSNERRSATIIALCNTELVCLGRQLFEQLASRSPNMMRHIAEAVAMRLRIEIRSRAAGSPPDNPSVEIDHSAAGASMKRKLAAILYADVFGYSRLMEEDEEETLRTLSAYRKIIDSLIKSHRGRFVNFAGDSVLSEFSSVVEAVNCAVEVQNALSTENALLPQKRRMEFRIGINLGVVMIDHGQIYGDGVNVAARLQSLAEPGSICISRMVHDQIGSKLPLTYEDLGEQTVKNIAKPVRVFRVMPTIKHRTQRS
ncbi:MAG: cyclic nucleotide-binding domain-containing protein [Deltaproteobacteria bacterium]|nr:cyclic nucleotide-binding domain-containing protein [Deltaproteobacteria bacterium]